jgi:ubiquinone/menaquinone biosynthesis C-methylase UbiE
MDIGRFDAILDFGCGVGRIMRQWGSLQHPILCGTDYNPMLVEWCRDNLKFAECRVNTLSGELPYESETFDFIYAFSVFTHFSMPLQFYWINELSRVLKPGGYIYLTAHGEYYLPVLSPEEQEQFREGRLVVREAKQAGSNICAAFHPEIYVREKMAQDFTVVDFIPSGAKGDSMHDIYLLKKPTNSTPRAE